jgi:putative redox protein
MGLKEQMLHWQAVARSGDAAACAEPMSGTVVQESPFYTEGRFGRHVVVIDEPTSFGGSDKAANPAEVMLAGVAASLCVTLRCHAALQGIAVGRIEVGIGGALDIRGFFDADPAVRAGFGSLDITMKVESDAAPEALQRLLAAVDRGCPVLDSVRGATPIRLALA